MTISRPHRNNPARIKREDYGMLWRTVEGAVVDAMQAHPEYVTNAGRRAMVLSVTKRTVGAITGLAHTTRKGSGSPL